MKQVISVIFVSFFIFLACKNGSSSADDLIVSIGNNILTKEEIQSAIPSGTNSEDSIIIANSYIQKWIRDILLYNIASNNIKDKNEIEQLVENYRKSLVSYQYQEQLLNEKISSDIAEEEIIKYYEENGNIFILEQNLIKGLFLKIPSNAPNINKIKDWYKSTSVKDLENIEKYSLQYAINYDYFYDRWVNLDEILSKIPNNSSNRMEQLMKEKCLITSDSTYSYFLNVTQILSVGDKAPYEYAKANIKKIILNQKRLDFIHQFEEDLYQSALKKGEVKFYEDQ